MRLIDADELMEHAWRDKLDSRELIAKMIDNAPTVKEIPTKIPIDVFEKLISQEPTTMIDKSNFSQEQYKADLQSAYDCGVASVKQDSTTKNDLADDCISRKFMYELGATCIATRNKKTGHLMALGMIEELPSVTPQEPRWIPVSERLPNLDDYTGSIMWQKKVLITGYLSFDDTKDLFISEAFAKDVIHNCVPDTIVIAWMPLPKPYEPQGSEGQQMSLVGITIEKSIDGIEKRILPIYDNDADHEALVTAINIMRKYQKIQGIISTYGNVETSFMCIDKIREVLEDGNG